MNLLPDWPDLTVAETIWLILCIATAILLLFYPFKRNKK